ncbi:hypothetical protein [Oceanirhabdus sp. W0125-5]|uniref:hypothetical protein n=1 Tax=Oceanirhabdus sp. W0125-5 TaxID=2999116 RepID=UPI0022F2EB93|nr:hypothetical protein [Oceanirhabdus sp. W0125-5]WBW97809.1 hypothetical protein OW730_03225 [Oceanirhabdus sp. W0125-5]
MYNRNHSPWWLDNDIIILILILLYYANNKELFRPPTKNLLSPISNDSPEHTLTDEELNRIIKDSPEVTDNNINTLKNILTYLMTLKMPENTEIRNNENSFNDSLYKNPPSDKKQNDNSEHIKSSNHKNSKNMTTLSNKNITPVSVINSTSVLNIDISLLQKSNILTSDKMIVHVPVIISQSNIEIIQDSDIKIEDSIKEIISIENNIDIRGMSLFYYEKSSGEAENRLFIKGVIIKNITFTALADNSLNEKYIEVTIPFKHTSKISFTSEPLIYSNNKSKVVKIYPNSTCENPIKSSNNIHPIYYELNHFDCIDDYSLMDDQMK